MPFEITNQGSYLLLRLVGVVTATDLLRAVEELEQIEGALPTALDRVTDVSNSERLDFHFDAVHDVADRRRQRVLKNPVRSALVAGRPVQVGYSRMFQILNNNPQIEIRIVDTMAEAMAWFAGGGAGQEAEPSAAADGQGM
jgi:hypothetical protein